MKMFLESVIKGAAKTTGSLLVFGIIGVAYMGFQRTVHNYFSSLPTPPPSPPPPPPPPQSETTSTQTEDDTKYKKVLDMFTI